MPTELWGLIVLALFYVGVQACLAQSGADSLDEAAMLPFADDPEVARRVELETGRSTTGCSCPGTCTGACKHYGEQVF
ncbi:hypothetical protein SAMN05216600_102236 [Pseudomonas cuatrocienegasensis]|uniref:Uncharacterized protein n=1 Tax=Pseudomonas cuatrocienegasensis TaxID=543360 RepID=A0ABY1B4Q0_9PSED|nr:MULTISPECIES: cytochrome Cbb oxidase CcoQ [Pseudomonas]SEP91054.1 hypothetical protein SAMN05216600_102236 [Pseudomonas cuatrocienegasensis]